MTAGAWVVSDDLQIGDLDPGAPELRAHSRYNTDVAYMINSYSVSTDVFAVIVKTPTDQCVDYESLSLANELEWRLRQVPGVEDVRGLNVRTREIMAGINEGYPKWMALFRNQDTINYAVTELVNLDYVDPACSIWPLIVYLADHKAATLTGVVDALELFNEEWPSEKAEFLGAAGSSGFEAATNIIVKKANTEMLYYVYGAVLVLCMLTFRSIPGVICAVLPLMMTSILCEALMVWLGIGVKVATLPVIALGVGIGVDYALYVLTVILAQAAAGDGSHQCLLRDPELHRPGCGPDRCNPGGGGRYLGHVSDQVPGRYGYPADLHVPVEYVWCPDPDACTGDISAQA